MSVTKLLLALIYKVHPFWKNSYQQVRYVLSSISFVPLVKFWD